MTLCFIFICLFRYSLEGVCGVLPIERSMTKPGRFRLVYTCAIACVTVMYVIFAAMCVIAFGHVTDGTPT